MQRPPYPPQQPPLQGQAPTVNHQKPNNMPVPTGPYQQQRPMVLNQPQMSQPPAGQNSAANQPPGPGMVPHLPMPMPMPVQQQRTAPLPPGAAMMGERPPMMPGQQQPMGPPMMGPLHPQLRPFMPQRPAMPMAGPASQAHLASPPVLDAAAPALTRPPVSGMAGISRPPMAAQPPMQQHHPLSPMPAPGISREPSAGSMHVPGPQQQQQQQSQNRINPALIPNPSEVMAAENERFRDGPFHTSQVLARVSPPRSYAATDAVQIIDDGNSSSRFARCSAWTLPTGEEVCEYTRLTLAVSLQPFAQVPAHEPPVPVVDFTLRGPIRCSRCRGYINPFVQWVRGGRSWSCNLCGAPNECPDDYFAQLDATGRRVDLPARPELRCGTVDIVVGSGDYMMRPQLSPTRLVFLVESSRAAVHSGAFRASLDAIRSLCHSPEARQLYSSAALVTFDRSVHFYDLRQSDSGTQAKVLVMSDLTEPFLPLAVNALFFPLSDEGCLKTLDKLLGQMVQQLFAETRVVESCLGAAAAVAIEALKATGGRVALFASSLPNAGPGALKNREAAVPASQLDKLNPLLLPQGEYYPRLAAQAAMSGISFTLCATPAAFLDLASIGVLASHTAGQTLMFTRFAYEGSGKQMAAELRHTLTRPFVFDCIARLRCGQGLQAGEYVGPCMPMPPGQSRPDVLFGALSCDQSFAVSLTYDGRLPENEPTGIQCAILHTTPNGQRRIRVINLALPATKVAAEVFRTVEAEAMISFLSKRLVGQLHAAPLAALSGYVVSRTSNVLAAYRKVSASNVSASQLIIPDELKLLPLLTLALNKTPGLSPSTANMDLRVHSLRLLADLPHDLLLPFFYPRLISLVSSADCPPGALPPPLRLSRESLDRQSIYLLENGMKMLIWVGDMVPSQLLQDVFGVGQLGQVNPNMMLPQLGNPMSKAISTAIGRIRLERQYQRPMSYQIVRPGIDHALEAEWLQALVEDSSPAGSSYIDWLCRLHGMIQTDMSSISSSLLADRSALLNFFH